MNNTFFNNSNVEMLYDIVNNEVRQETLYDLDKDMKYKSIFRKLIKTVYDNRKTNNLQNLNNTVIEKCVPYLTQHIRKKQKVQSNVIRGNELNLQKIGLSQRPQFSKKKYVIPNQSSDLPPNNLNMHLSELPMPQNTKPDPKFKVSNNYSKNDINGLLQNLELNVPNRPQSSNNSITTDKKPDETSFNDYLEQRKMFENELKKSEESQKILLNDMTTNKEKDSQEFLKTMNNQRNFNDYDPKKMFKMETNKNPIPQFDLEPKDQSSSNEVINSKEDIEDFKKLKDNNWRQPHINEASEKSMNELFQNPGYVKERQPYEMVIIEKRLATAGDDADFKATLTEDLNIDKLSDVYLEFLSLHDLGDNADAGGGTDKTLEQYPFFAIECDELNFKTSTNNNELKDKYIIPNDSFGKTDTAEFTGDNEDDNSTDLHIKLKSNFMTTILPRKISELNFKIYGYSADADSLSLLKANNDHARVLIGLLIKKI